MVGDSQAFEEAYRELGFVNASNNGKPKTFTAADLLAQELPPVRWAVQGLVPEGVTLLTGKPKLGKSWFGLGLCIANATGGVALGKVPVEEGESLLLALEDNRRRLHKRLGKVLNGEAPPTACTSPPSGPD